MQIPLGDLPESPPRLFWAVGAFYAVFDQTSDEKVKRLLWASPDPSGEVRIESNPYQKLR